MVPKRGTGSNLLVPVALSASAVAYSSTRIENMFMSVGSAAGVAAKQLVDGDVSTVQDVDVTKVQAILTKTFNQRIHGPTGTDPSPPAPPMPQWYEVTGAGSKVRRHRPSIGQLPCLCCALLSSGSICGGCSFFCAASH